MAVDPTTPSTIYAGTWNYGIYKSVDGGASWSAANNGVTTTFIEAIALDPKSPGTLYAGTDYGGVYKSTNNGGTWSAINNGITNKAILALAIDPTVPSIIYAGGAGLYKSLDGGGTWNAINNGVNDIVTTLAIDPSTPSTIYAGTQTHGVYRSLDGGSSWTAINTGFTGGELVNLSISPAMSSTLYAGTYQGGVLAIDFSFSMSGTVTGPAGVALSGVTISDGAGDSTTTDANGNYTIPNLKPGNYTFVPSKTGYTFSPPNRSYTNVQSDQSAQNYAAIPLPPLVIVHGWLGLDPTGDKCANGIQQYDGTNSTMGDLPNWFTYTYDVWIAHLDTSATYTPPLQANADCLSNELIYVHSRNAQPMTLITHSMGGLVARAAIQSLPANVKIRALYTLGSPHAGVPVEVLGLLFGPASVIGCIKQPVVCQFSLSFMTLFNVLNPNRAHVAYNFIGGDGSGLGTPPKWNSIVDAFSAPDDGVVGKYSAVGWILNSKNFLPPTWASQSSPSQYWTDEFHLPDWGVNYYTGAPDTNPYSHAYKCISALMAGKAPDPAYCIDAKTTNSPTHSPATSTASLSALTPVQSGHLNAGQNISIPITIDTSSSSLFYLSWNGTAPSFTLTRPDSQVIDPTYAAAHPSEVTYDSFAGGSEVPPYADYSFPATQPGTWQLNITASGSGAVDFQAFAALDSTRTLTAQTNADTYAIGDTATISANLQSSGVGLAGATVTANITRPDSVVDIVSLTDQGNGTYSNTYTIPNAPGFLGIDVTATGNDNGTAFTRQEHLIASIKSNALQLTGAYGDQPIDNNGDGLYEQLNFTAGANLALAGEYEVSADLYSGTQFVTHFADFFNLSAGAQTIALPFDGMVIREAGLNGPYTIKNLSLTPMDTGIPSQSVDSAWVTPPYSYTQFGVNAFSDVPNTYWAQTWIQRLYNAGITGGCSTNPLNYCPDNNVTRDQMAVFLERGMHSSSFSPPTVPLTFSDTTGNFAQYWIEALKSDGITSGCGSGLYCPTSPTTRAQMAVFLLKSEHGSSYTPPPVTGTKFTDVPASYWAASWIEQLANEGITSGCGINLYCPDQSVTRAQMAVFLVKTFNLP